MESLSTREGEVREERKVAVRGEKNPPPPQQVEEDNCKEGETTATESGSESGAHGGGLPPLPNVKKLPPSPFRFFLPENIC